MARQQRTIRIWSGNRVVQIITVAQDGSSSSTAGGVGGAENSALIDIEIDPWAGLIVDRATDNPPTYWRDLGAE